MTISYLTKSLIKGMFGCVHRIHLLHIDNGYTGWQRIQAKKNSLSVSWCVDTAAAAVSDNPDRQASVVVVFCLPPIASGCPALPLLLTLPSSDSEDVSALSRRAGGFVLALATGDSPPPVTSAFVSRDRDGVSITDSQSHTPCWQWHASIDVLLNSCKTNSPMNTMNKSNNNHSALNQQTTL